MNKGHYIAIVLTLLVWACLGATYACEWVTPNPGHRKALSWVLGMALGWLAAHLVINKTMDGQKKA